MPRYSTFAFIVALLLVTDPSFAAGHAPVYTIVDTDQDRCYDDHTEIHYPAAGDAYFGQDAHYTGNEPKYRDNRDGTITDLITGLMWQKDPGEKKPYTQAVAGAKDCRVGGHTDWRLPTIKELYSLIQFSGVDPDVSSRNASQLTPFINHHFFKFQYGDERDGDRIIDSQYATSTTYVDSVMNGRQAMFGVNFADGRIKGYPIDAPGRGNSARRNGPPEKTFYVMYVRGNADYGKNQFVANGDGTITDRATGLTWMQVDSGHLKAGESGDGAMTWPEALKWAEDLDYAGHTDWRLPNAKELQSIVDYTRSPGTTESPAIDPVFRTSSIINEGGKTDYPYFWTSTTHTRLHQAEAAVYIAFGRALGYMADRRSGSTEKKLMDVHGAGAQRSDVKAGDPSKLPIGRGPQGDVMRIYNYVRCVRGGMATPRASGPAVRMRYVRHAPPDEGDSARPAGPPSSAAQFIRRHDDNSDGKVSRSEFPGPAEHFTQFDRNRDGYISSNEAPDGPPDQRDDRGNRPQPPGRRPN